MVLYLVGIFFAFQLIQQIIPASQARNGALVALAFVGIFFLVQRLARADHLLVEHRITAGQPPARLVGENMENSLRW